MMESVSLYEGEVRRELSFPLPHQNTAIGPSSARQEDGFYQEQTDWYLDPGLPSHQNYKEEIPLV